MITPNILEETSRGIQAFRIEDAMLRKREVFLTGEINETSAAEVLKQLMYLEQEAADPITLYISSPGGSVLHGMAIYDYIRLMRAAVNTVCIGFAASMAAILFLAGEQRQMLPHSRIMIHDPSFGGGASVAGQKPHEIQEKLNELMEMRRMLADVIVQRTGLSREHVLKLTRKDTYFDAERARKEGLATQILGDLADFDSCEDGEVPFH